MRILLNVRLLDFLMMSKEMRCMPLLQNTMVAKLQMKILELKLIDLIASTIGAIAKLDKIQFVSGLPKTRSGKIMRRILRKIASNEADNLGDISTLLNPDVVEEIKAGAL